MPRRAAGDRTARRRAPGRVPRLGALEHWRQTLRRRAAGATAWLAIRRDRPRGRPVVRRWRRRRLRPRPTGRIARERRRPAPWSGSHHLRPAGDSRRTPSASPKKNARQRQFWLLELVLVAERPGPPPLRTRRALQPGYLTEAPVPVIGSGARCGYRERRAERLGRRRVGVFCRRTSSRSPLRRLDRTALAERDALSCT